MDLPFLFPSAHQEPEVTALNPTCDSVKLTLLSINFVLNVELVQLGSAPNTLLSFHLPFIPCKNVYACDIDHPKIKGD